jgi:hypothetical protein
MAVALNIAPEQKATFKWMVQRLERKEWHQLAQHVPNSVERCMKAPAIQPLMMAVGRERIKEFIEARLIWLVSQLNVANTMTPQQIDFASETLLERYPTESLADFVLCFKRGAQGYYGSTYHQLDTSVIMGWMANYIEEKAMYVERDVTKSHAEEKENAIDYEAFKKRLEKERTERREKRILALEKEADAAEAVSGYTPLTVEQLAERELHDRYLGAKWKHDQDPFNRTGNKVTKPFMTEAEWREEQKVIEALKAQSEQQNDNAYAPDQKA